MDKKKITIVTGTGGILGTGHIQRMLNLAVHLNMKNNFSASIYLTKNQHPVDSKFDYLLTDLISPDTDLIIKDMRDSSADEINSLRKTAPVLTIDDSGEGKDYADYSLNLLPVPSEKKSFIKPETSLFIYGYNFAEGISQLKHKSVSKDIDITVYAGYAPSPDLISSIKKCMPESINSILLKKGKPVNLTGDFLKSEISYAEIIARSKIVMTHFGLTMFEADACRCKIAALDPTEYHSKLTEIMNQDFNIIYSSEYTSLSIEDLMNTIETELKNKSDNIILPDEILNKINTGTENFIKYIEAIIIKR